jgi:ADP-heptose:LPS heptosyltransferase
MDGIDAVPEYARSLEVPMLLGDFETIPAAEVLAQTRSREPFRLITMVHVFEHMYAPEACLKKLRELVGDEGRVFLRLPDHGVAGFERDLTPGHYTIHPFFYSLESLLELLVRKRDLFTIERTYALEGAGQRDVILRPIHAGHQAPSIGCGMIVKNEARDLPRCLGSIASVVDHLEVVDTGSTDETLAIANSFESPARSVRTRTYTGASEQDESGDWKLYDFGKARNVAIAGVEEMRESHYLWMDADDELLAPEKLRRLIYRDDLSVFGLAIDNGGGHFIHHRLWRTGLGIRFEGACHEYPTHGGHPGEDRFDIVVRHDAKPGEGEGANARNLRILEREAKTNPSPRTLFYLAQTHKDGGRHKEAIPWYEKRIQAGQGYRDEWLFAFLYKARCERASGDPRAAEKTLLGALAQEPSWSEFWMELAYLKDEQGQHEHAIGYALLATRRAIPPTALWRESNKYTDQPPRLISWAYDHLGQKEEALAWARIAKKEIGAKDHDWDARIRRLEGGKEKPILCLHRPGAIGDVLMTLNLVPLLREKLPEHAIHYACATDIGSALRNVMIGAGVNHVEPSDGFFDRASAYDKSVNLIGYPIHEGYPERAMRKHLIRHFADEMGLDLPHDAPIPALRLPRPARPRELPKRYATFQVKTGWSAYKEWPLERWRLLIERMPDVHFVQIGREDEPHVEGADHSFMGTSISTAIALVANASLHVGLDSFANHLTHYLWEDEDGSASRTPGVILWGSTQPLASGYETNTNVCLCLPCQPCFREDPKVSRMSRGPCPNPPLQVYEEPRHACMHEISVDQVVSAIQKYFDTSRGGQLNLKE